jgi:hypothetical protein
MAIRNSERDIPTELRYKAKQYRAFALARSIDDDRLADIANKKSRACATGAQQIEHELASSAA